jgi:hypothetical protein
MPRLQLSRKYNKDFGLGAIEILNLNRNMVANEEPELCSNQS